MQPQYNGGELGGQATENDAPSAFASTLSGLSEDLLRSYSSRWDGVENNPDSLDASFPIGWRRTILHCGPSDLRELLQHLMCLSPCLTIRSTTGSAMQVEKLMRHAGDWLGSHPEKDASSPLLTSPGLTALCCPRDTSPGSHLLDAQLVSGRYALLGVGGTSTWCPGAGLERGAAGIAMDGPGGEEGGIGRGGTGSARFDRRCYDSRIPGRTVEQPHER